MENTFGSIVVLTKLKRGQSSISVPGKPVKTQTDSGNSKFTSLVNWQIVGFTTFFG